MVLALCISCSDRSKLPSRPPVPVRVGAAIQKTVPVQIRVIGNVEAYNTVEIKSRVTGQLKQIHFQEGQEVKQGDLLFTIDPRPFQAELDNARAELAKNKALARYARIEARRYNNLVKQDLVSREEYDNHVTRSDSLDAAVKADAADVERARLNLSYCFIYAPISGRTGNKLVYAGNMIKANADDPMVVINQLQPIYVSFAVPEKDLPEIKKYMARGELKVKALIPGDKDQPPEGVLTFIDNAVDTQTGTIQLKGTFANQDKRLWPGQFVEVALELTTLPGVTVVPSQAIQLGQEGKYLIVVRSDQTVEFRPVTTGITHDKLTVVNQGIKPGEMVVTDGQLRLAPGFKVKITNLAAGRQDASP